MKNIIMCAIASDNGQYCETVESYIQNAFTALKSAKINSDDQTECILVTNIAELPLFYSNLFKNNNIQILYHGFESFLFNDIPWKLAYYKLDALKFMMTLSFEKIILVDTDTLFIRDTTMLFEEVDEILLYKCPFSLATNDRKVFLNEARNFFNNQLNLEYFGGEFVAGTRDKITCFIQKCESIYLTLINNNQYSVRGDEFIWSMAASNFKVKSANAYIDRLWTGKNYEVTTYYWYYDICILHLPREKKTGLHWFYKYFTKHDHLPKMTKIKRILGLPDIRRKITTVHLFHLKNKLIHN